MDDRLRREYAETLKKNYLTSGFKQGFEAGYAKAKEDFERPHGEWIECEDKRYCECSNCWVLVTKKEAEDFGYCPNCGSDNRPRDGEREK